MGEANKIKEEKVKERMKKKKTDRDRLTTNT